MPLLPYILYAIFMAILSLTQKIRRKPKSKFQGQTKIQNLGRKKIVDGNQDINSRRIPKFKIQAEKVLDGNQIKNFRRKAKFKCRRKTTFPFHVDKKFNFQAETKNEILVENHKRIELETWLFWDIALLTLHAARKNTCMEQYAIHEQKLG